MSGERPRFERRDIRPGSVLKAGVLIALITAVSAGGMYALFRSLKGGAPESSVAGPPQPPEPRLQTNERADLGMILEPQRRRLESYGWVDRPAGIVHIPIQEAMRELLARGVPVRDPVAAVDATSIPTDSGGMR